MGTYQTRLLLAGLAFGAVVLVGCFTSDPPPQVARVVCDESGTKIVTRSVSPQLDGVHVVIDNRLGFDAGFAVGFENGAGAGRNAPEGESRHVLGAPPGRVEIGCYGNGSPQPDFQTLEVVDSEGVYRSVELACASVVSGTSDFGEGASGQRATPVDLGRELFDNAFGLGSDDVVELGGYLQSEVPVVRLMRDGRIVATVSYRRADGDGWLEETFSMCEELAQPA